jgi:hypothetical protein
MKVLVVVVFLTISAPGCSKSTTSDDIFHTTRHAFPQQGFSISFPSHWGILKGKEQPIGSSPISIVTAVSPDPLDKGANISVSFAPLPREMTAKELFDLNVPGMQGLPDFRETARGEAIVAGIPSQWITFTHEEQGRQKRVTIYSIVKGTKAFLITLTAADAQRENVTRALKDALRLMEID